MSLGCPLRLFLPSRTLCNSFSWRAKRIINVQLLGRTTQRRADDDDRRREVSALQRVYSPQPQREAGTPTMRRTCACGCSAHRRLWGIGVGRLRRRGLFASLPSALQLGAAPARAPPRWWHHERERATLRQGRRRSQCVSRSQSSGLPIPATHLACSPRGRFYA